jgi:CSLREA domain-containing protein
VFIAGVPTRAAGANFTVDSTSDAVDAAPGDGACESAAGECTLRAAIQETNALPGADAISVPAGTYTLAIPGANEDDGATGDLDITDDVAITGAGQNATVIDGKQIDRLFHTRLFFHSELLVELDDLTIWNGSIQGQGGGIFLGNGTSANITDVRITGNSSTDGGGGVWAGDAFSDSLFAFTRVEISDNTAGLNDGGGLTNFGRMTMTDSVVRANSGGSGGGIENDRDLTVVRGIISDNHAAVEGGVSNSGTSRFSLIDSVVVGNSAVAVGGLNVVGQSLIVRSSIMRNTASQEAGGLRIDDVHSGQLADSTISDNRAGTDGGGIYVWTLEGGNPTLTNLTISGNRAEREGGGAFVLAGEPRLTNVTLAGNTAPAGAGLATHGDSDFGSLHVMNSIFADNIPENCSDTVNSLGHNLDDGKSCGLSAAGDRTNTEPVLLPLGDNGGTTLTQALSPASFAIDAGDGAACPSADQRGELRPQDGDGDGVAVCDIGAYEAPRATVTRTPAVTTPPGETPGALPNTGLRDPATGTPKQGIVGGFVSAVVVLSALLAAARLRRTT